VIDVDRNLAVECIVKVCLFETHDTGVVAGQLVVKCFSRNLEARLLCSTLVDRLAHLERRRPVSVLHHVGFVEGLDVAVLINDAIVQMPVN